MTTVIFVSVLAPIAAGALFLAARHRMPKPAADTRGIALQTIIIIVVLLAIAGAVTGVLLTTAGRTTQQAESADVTTAIDSEEECNATTLVDSGIGRLGPVTTGCTFTAADPLGEGKMSLSECSLRGGIFTKGQRNRHSEVCGRNPDLAAAHRVRDSRPQAMPLRRLTAAPGTGLGDPAASCDAGRSCPR